jgi:SAM-dependent methyltransferase
MMIRTEDVEHAACPLCASDVPAATPYAEGGWAVAECGACGLYYLSPRLKEASMIACYTDDGYFEGGGTGYESYAEQAGSLRATFERLLRTMARQGLLHGRLLEIGCGYGFFLEAAAPYFEHRAGTEFSSRAAAIARGRADQIYLGSLEAVPPGERFDCIVALHVMEHVYEPLRLLARMRDFLTCDGVIVVAVPDMGGIWRKAMGRYWPSFKFPEHVAYYDAGTLGRLLRTAGFRRIEGVPYPHAFPLGLILRKLKLPAMRVLSGQNVWLPGTTVALAARP